VEYDRLDQLLDEYEGQLGLTPFVAREAACLRYLDLSEGELRSLSPEDCGVVSVQLANFALYLTRAANREQSRLRWVEAKQMENAAPRLDSYPYKTPAERLHLALSEDDYGRRLVKLAGLIRARLDRLDYLPRRLEQSAEMFSRLSTTKKRRPD
jgi:hypothetical protein